MAVDNETDQGLDRKGRIKTRALRVLEDQLERPLPPGLYLVATPIGHLADMSLRALSTLARADFVAAEDTRHSGKLMHHYGIEADFLSYHDHNGKIMGPRIVSLIEEGRSVALISDAGTPLISDPGFKLVRDMRAAGLPVEVVPGASAVMAGLSLSALPTDRFLFEGFLPPKETARQTRLQVLSAIPATLVFFETVKRIEAVLDDIMAIFGDRQAALLRELTKLHEEVIGGRLSDIRAELEIRSSRAEGLRGELVLVVGPPEVIEITDEMITAALKEAMLKGMSARDSVKQVAAQFSTPKGRVYELSIAMKKSDG